MKKRINFMNLLKRQKLTQQQFATKVESAWTDISGRSLSRQAVNAWINGREVPKFSPGEILAVVEILECTLTELAIAFSDQKKEKLEKKS